MSSNLSGSVGSMAALVGYWTETKDGLKWTADDRTRLVLLGIIQCCSRSVRCWEKKEVIISVTS